jgi:hypothetical protein
MLWALCDLPFNRYGLNESRTHLYVHAEICSNVAANFGWTHLRGLIAAKNKSG